MDAGFLFRRDDELIVVQGLTFPFTGIQIQHAASLFGEVWIPRKDPTAVMPRTDRVRV
jgi:hypothetical protein